MPADPREVHWFIRNLRHTKGKWAGKPFDVLPWQDDLISSLFELNPDGSRAKRRAYIQCGRKAGKCSSPDSPVPTPDGWRTIGDLAVGNRVFAVDGTPTTVTAIGTWTDRPMWRLHFNDGTTADADENHEWPVYFSPGVRNRPNRSTRWIVDRLNSSSSGVSLVQNAAVQFPEADLPIHPYVLGMWLGDGSRHFGSITSMDWDEFAPAIESLGYELLPVQPSSVREGNRATNRTISGLSAALRDEGLLLNKHIPDAYLTASVGQRLDLLAGIIDTDGYVSKSNDRTPVVEITLCHERLANDVLALTRSLGFRPLFKKQECPGAKCGWKWTVSFYAERHELPLRLTRKLDRIPVTLSGRGRRHHVVGCERLPDGPSISIEIDHPSHVFMVGDGYVPTHNSEIGAAIGLALLVCDKEPGGEVIMAAGKRDQARIMLDVAKRMVRFSKINGTPLEKFLTLRQDGIYFPELDGVLKVISADGEKEHGANPHAVIMDELHVLGAKRDLWDAMETAQGARENPLLISFTTPGPAPIGIAYDEYRHARQVMAGVINDPTFLPVIFEADRDLDIDNPEAWRQANPSYPITPNEEWMEARAKAVLDGRAPEYVFRRLQLSQWTSALERWLPRAKWEACGGPAVIPDGGDVWVGIDAALKRDSFGVSLLYVERGWTEDENGLSIPADIGHLKVWAFVPTEEGEYIDQEDVRTHIMGLAARYNIQKVSYDPAYMTLFAQQLEGSGLPIEPFPQSPERMMKATETFQRVVLNERLRHGNDRTIDEQVASLGIRESDRGVRISKSRSGGRIDAISAAVMCIEEAFGGEDEPQDFFYMD